MCLHTTCHSRPQEGKKNKKRAASVRLFKTEKLTEGERERERRRKWHKNASKTAHLAVMRQYIRLHAVYGCNELSQNTNLCAFDSGREQKTKG